MIEHIRTVTDKPIKYVVLSHYHAVRVLGASGYGAEHIICSEATRDLIVERGAAGLQVRDRSASRACSRRPRRSPA